MRVGQNRVAQLPRQGTEIYRQCALIQPAFAACSGIRERALMEGAEGEGFKITVRFAKLPPSNIKAASAKI